jgi:hypothetical protein
MILRRHFHILGGLIWLFVIAFLHQGCATGAKPFDELTPKEKLAYMYQVYNAQHEDYMAMAAMPNLTEAQKEILRKKKPILNSLQTLIPAYDQQVRLGAPSAQSEQQIYNMLNQLQGYVIQLE